jgi:hypothetical protein
MAAKAHQGNAVPEAICRQAAATARDAAAISCAAAGSVLPQRAVHSQARPVLPVGRFPLAGGVV